MSAELLRDWVLAVVNTSERWRGERSEEPRTRSTPEAQASLGISPPPPIRGDPFVFFRVSWLGSCFVGEALVSVLVCCLACLCVGERSIRGWVHFEVTKPLGVWGVALGILLWVGNLGG